MTFDGVDAAIGHLAGAMSSSHHATIVSVSSLHQRLSVTLMKSAYVASDKVSRCFAAVAAPY